MTGRSSTYFLVLTGTLGILGSACGGPTRALLSQPELRDPTTCKSCHPAQFAAWGESMHAYAADDPVFIAMNQRGQRETGGALGNFCVNCHAPMAVRDGLTQDGLNLATLSAPEKGVTCFFCHSAASVDGTHDNPLTLATDGTLFGPFSDPVASPPHGAAYSQLLDDGHLESAAACGSCHDIVNRHGVALERTFEEWQGTLFSGTHGLSCAGCHMPGSDGPASSVSTKVRRVHDHGFPAVDVALTAFPLLGADGLADQTRNVQAMLDSTAQGTICYDDATQRITVAVDNVGAGHSLPSGASQDRRLWTEVAAYAGTTLLYQSGVQPGETIEGASDPDLWLVRDCIFDDSGAEVQMFWQAASETINLFPGPVTATAQDPSSLTKSHLKYVFPTGTRTVPGIPDRITLGVSLKAVGDDVLASLVGSGDLDPAIAAAVPTFHLGGGAALEWARATAMPYLDPQSGDRLLCVTTGTFTPISTVTTGVSHARCATP
ncbi:MAG TPA: multiheme c-type cytochrome [Polyangia bacterium]|jgi:hypothetical protein